MTDKNIHQLKHAGAVRMPTPIENTTEATRGEPLAIRAQKRRAELAKALDKLDVEELRARNDIELAMSSIDGLLTGNPEHLSDTTAAELSRLLEGSKHLAEIVHVKRQR
jgi:hypothetical protein